MSSETVPVDRSRHGSIHTNIADDQSPEAWHVSAQQINMWRDVSVQLKVITLSSSWHGWMKELVTQRPGIICVDSVNQETGPLLEDLHQKSILMKVRNNRTISVVPFLRVVFVVMRKSKDQQTEGIRITGKNEGNLFKPCESTLNDCYTCCIHELIWLSGLIFNRLFANQMVSLIWLSVNYETQSSFSVS